MGIGLQLRSFASRMSPASRLAIATICVAGALLLLGIAAAWARLEMRVMSASMSSFGHSFVLPSPGSGRFLASKYCEAAADAVWTRLLVYYGEQTSRARDPKFMAAYVDAIVAFDPMFRPAYAWSGYAIPLATSGWVNPENVESGIRILRAGTARFPADAELHGMLGYDLFYELPRWVSGTDRIVRAKVEGAEHLRAQAALGGGTGWQSLSVTSALQEVSLDDLAARHLEESAYATDDRELRERILGRLAALRATSDVEAIGRAADTLDGVRGDRAAYLSATLFMLVSPTEALERMAEGKTPPPLPED